MSHAHEQGNEKAHHGDVLRDAAVFDRDCKPNPGATYLAFLSDFHAIREAMERFMDVVLDKKKVTSGRAIVRAPQGSELDSWSLLILGFLGLLIISQDLIALRLRHRATPTSSREFVRLPPAVFT